MNRPTAGNATLGPIEELAMGLLSWLVNSSNDGGWLRRWVMPTRRRRRRRSDVKLEGIKRAAEADVAAMEAEDREYFRQDGPGYIEDDL
jgi:hypothetical protein